MAFVLGKIGASGRRIEFAAVHRDLLDHGAERDCREVGQAADDQDHADQEADEERAVRREGAGRGR